MQGYEGKSDEEIIADLNRQADESRMTISVSAKPKLSDGKVRVNVSNVAENKFSQTFTLSQDGVELYSSGLIAPGEVVEWCDAPDAHEGPATVRPARRRATPKPFPSLLWRRQLPGTNNATFSTRPKR